MNIIYIRGKTSPRRRTPVILIIHHRVITAGSRIQQWITDNNVIALVGSLAIIHKSLGSKPRHQFYGGDILVYQHIAVSSRKTRQRKRDGARIHDARIPGAIRKVVQDRLYSAGYRKIGDI